MKQYSSLTEYSESQMPFDQTVSIVIDLVAHVFQYQSTTTDSHIWVLVVEPMKSDNFIEVCM